jgi:hypothetical protein
MVLAAYNPPSGFACHLLSKGGFIRFCYYRHALRVVEISQLLSVFQIIIFYPLESNFLNIVTRTTVNWAGDIKEVKVTVLKKISQITFKYYLFISNINICPLIAVEFKK